MEDFKLTEDPNEIRLNENQEIQQILGSPPGWLLRWGISMVFFTTAVLLLLSWLVKYPDVIATEVVVTTENPPIHVFTRTSGKISELLVKAQDKVKAGDLLAVMENPANWKDVEKLDQFLNTADVNSSLGKLGDIQLPQNLKLGPLQTLYSKLSQGIGEFQYLSREDAITETIAALKEQINQLISLNNSLESQRNTLTKVVGLAKQNFERNQELFKKEVASQLEVENAQTNFLQAKRQLESLDSEIINNKVRIQQLDLSIIQTKLNQKDQQYPKYFGAQEDLQQLKSAINIWKQAYLIIAPISGAIEMSEVWSANQFLNDEQEILTIVPDNVSNRMISKAYLPFNRSGKVKAGMVANIRFDAFPYQEFGMVKGTVKSISEVPTEKGYLMELAIPDPIISTYQKVIPFRQEMQGTTHIITEDRRVLERIFDKILSAMKNREGE